MGVRDRFLTVLAGQLGHPRGLPGRLVGQMLNRGNKAAITAAVDALEIPAGAVLADLGFGGGIGLELLLRRLEARPGNTGQVHGVDRSATMLAAAKRRFSNESSTGRLILHRAPIERLPLATASLDGAITLNTLYFVTDLKSALSEFARVIKPGGRLVIGLADPEAMARQPVTAHGFHVRSIAQVTGALLEAGLEVDQDRRIGNDTNAFHLLVTRAAG
jgi:arsenite methyltransferase